MSIKIEFDYQIFSLQKHGGISRYFTEIASRIAAMPGVEAEINCPLFINEYLRNLPGPLVNGRHVGAYRKTMRLRNWLNGRLSRGSARNRGRGIRHLTYYRFDPRPGLMNVVSVFDMAHERFPEEFPARDRTSREKAAAVERADAVICISANTRRELLELLPIDPEKVFVTHLGFTPLSAPSGFIPPEWMLGPPFLLYVGNRGGYKNFLRLLAGFGASPALHKACLLVCLGGGAFNETESAAIKRHGLEGRVRQSGADDALLGYGYAHAQALVYPSIYEGFGIPPLEAMSSGCPVICGLNTSLAEVVGNAAHIVDPLDEGSLAQGMEAVLASSVLRAELTRAGRERAALFSWDKCARETLAIYASLGAGAAPAAVRSRAPASPEAGFQP